MERPPSTLIIACGALARELIAVIRANDLRHLTVSCLPAHLHNHPRKIPDAVRRKIQENRGRYDEIRVLYGDCGTGGRLDAVLAEEGVERIPGAHCYEFFVGSTHFEALAETEPGAFYLTDYLVRHFDRLVIKGLGLDRFPDLRDDYFRHYDRVIYLAQTRDSDLERQARKAAERLGLELVVRYTGLTGLDEFVRKGPSDDRSECDNSLLA